MAMPAKTERKSPNFTLFRFFCQPKEGNHCLLISDAGCTSPAVCESERKIIMTIKQRKMAAALTLIEVMTAVLIVTIVIAGGSFLFVMGRNQVSLQKHYRVASQLAAQKLEKLKACDYAGVVCDSNSDSLEGVSYTTNTTVVDVNSSYKEVTVTVGWGPGRE